MLMFRKKMMERIEKCNRAYAIILVLLLIGTCIFVAFSTFAAAEEDIDTYETDWGYFSTEQINAVPGSLIGGQDIGDVDNDGELELVAGGGGNQVHIIEYSNFERDWTIHSIDTGSMGLLGINICDINSSKTGNEVLVGGLDNVLMEFNFNGESFTRTDIMEMSDPIWDIKVGDLIPEKSGDEIAIAHSTEEISVLYKENGAWTETKMQVAAATRTLEIGEIYGSHAGLELVTASEEGHVDMFYWNSGAFKHHLILKGDRAIRNVDIGDFFSGNPGNELFLITYSFNAGNASYVYMDGNVWKEHIIYGSDRGLEALALGDFNPLSAGIEPVFAGYSNTVTMAVEDEGTLTARDIWTLTTSSMTNEIVSIAVGDLYPNHKGAEVFILGYDGSLKMTYYEYPGAVLDFENPGKSSVPYKETTLVKTNIRSKGGFEGHVDITCKVLDSNGKDVETGSFNIEYPGSVELYTENKPGIVVQITPTLVTAGDKYTLEITLDPDGITEGKKVFTSPLEVTAPIPPHIHFEELIWEKKDGHYQATIEIHNSGTNTEVDLKAEFILNGNSLFTVIVPSVEPGKTMNITRSINPVNGNNSLCVLIKGIPSARVENSNRTVYLTKTNDENGGFSARVIIVILGIIIILLIAILVTFAFLRRGSQPLVEDDEESDRGKSRKGGTIERGRGIGRRRH